MASKAVLGRQFIHALGTVVCAVVWDDAAVNAMRVLADLIGDVQGAHELTDVARGLVSARPDPARLPSDPMLWAARMIEAQRKLQAFHYRRLGEELGAASGR